MLVCNIVGKGMPCPATAVLPGPTTGVPGTPTAGMLPGPASTGVQTLTVFSASSCKSRRHELTDLFHDPFDANVS